MPAPFALSALSPFGPIFGKELRCTARRKRSYVLRVIYLALLLLALLFAWTVTSNYSAGSASARQQQQAQLAQVFFGAFSIFCVGSMGLIGPVLTATAINSERLHRTLHVLLMTPITNWQIVSGKLFSRMLIALTLIGLSLPVLALVRLLGAVELEQMFGVLCLAVVTALTGAAIGMFFSTLLRRGYAVILLSYALIGFLYAFVPMIVALILDSIPGVREAVILKYLCYGNPFLCAAFLAAGAPLSVPWEACCVAHVILSTLLIACSALLLRRMARRENEGAPAAAAVAVPPREAFSAAVALPAPLSAEHGPQPNAAAAPGPERIRKPARPIAVSDNPVLWRELRRPLMSRVWQRVLGVVLCGLLFGVTYGVFGWIDDLDDRDVQVGFVLVFHGLATLMVCVLAATAIAQEKEGDTWTLLLTTPLSGRSIILGKFWGVARKMMWPMALVTAHLVIFAISGMFPFSAVVLAMWVILAFNAVWIATGIFFSLCIRKVTFAVVLNLMLPVLVYAVIPVTLLVAGELFGSGPWSGVNLAELTAAYQPYYYLAEGLGHMYMRDHYAHGNWDHIWFPTGTHVDFDTFLTFTFGAGLVYLSLTALVLWRTIAHFDRLVGRAPGQKASFFPSTSA